MRKREKGNIFFQLFGAEFISKPVRRKRDKKEIARLNSNQLKKA